MVIKVVAISTGKAHLRSYSKYIEVEETELEGLELWEQLNIIVERGGKTVPYSRIGDIFVFNGAVYRAVENCYVDGVLIHMFEEAVSLKPVRCASSTLPGYYV
jgi:hypothetical protein